jgi:adenylosuccinate lyase
VIAFLTAVEEKVGPASRYIHLGCTSSDIVDTANGILLTRAGGMILQRMDELLATLEEMAKRNKGRLVMGRTHGIHAEPTSFGLKMAGFHAEFQRHRARFEAAVQSIRCGKISGAVGTYAQLDPEVERIACVLLGLEVDPISTQIVQRDRYAHYFTALALVAGGIERLSTELRHLQRTEVLEVEEGFSKGQKGSSAMPHKKNPISAENLCGLSRLVRTNSLAAMENMALWHERDISHSSVERVIMPDSTILVDYMLARLNSVMKPAPDPGEHGAQPGGLLRAFLLPAGAPGAHRKGPAAPGGLRNSPTRRHALLGAEALLSRRGARGCIHHRCPEPR